MKLSIVVPGIRPELWSRLFNSISESCSSEFEVIFVGPKHLPVDFTGTANVKYVKDFGCPSRALQIGMTMAEGELVTYISDDCMARKNAIDTILDFDDTSVCLQYSESPGFSGQAHPLDYYRSGHHADLRCKNIDPNWIIPIIFLMKREKFEYYGGIDCKMEHVNMNLHDLAFRMQRDGEEFVISNEVIWDADFVNRTKEDPVLAAFYENDKPLFDAIYNSETFYRPTKIPPDNWKQVPSIWPRRFKLI